MKTKSLLSVFLVLSIAFASLVYTPSYSYAKDTTKLTAPVYDAEKDYAEWDCIYLGSYPQDTLDVEDKQPIKWRVLSIDDSGNALILMDKCITKAGGVLNGMSFSQMAFSEQEAAQVTGLRSLTLEEACNPAYGFCSDPAKASDTRKAEITKFALEYNDLAGNTEPYLPKEYNIVQAWPLSTKAKYDKTMCVGADGGGVNTDGILIMNDQPGKPYKTFVNRFAANVNLNDIDTWSYAGKVNSGEYVNHVPGNTGDNTGETPLVPDNKYDNLPVELRPTPRPDKGNNASADNKVVSVSASENNKPVNAEVKDTFSVKGLEYKVLPDEKSVSVLGFSGKAKKGTLTIPDKVNVKGKSYKVTEIAESAFAGETQIKQVVIGKNITSVGNKAFEGCKKLKKINVKSKKISKVGKKAFAGIRAGAAVKGAKKIKKLIR